MSSLQSERIRDIDWLVLYENGMSVIIQGPVSTRFINDWTKPYIEQGFVVVLIELARLVLVGAIEWVEREIRYI